MTLAWILAACSNYHSYYILVKCQTFKCVVNANSEKKLNVEIVPRKTESLLTFSVPVSVLSQAGAMSQWMQALEFESRYESACLPNQGLSRAVASL